MSLIHFNPFYSDPLQSNESRINVWLLICAIKSLFLFVCLFFGETKWPWWPVRLLRLHQSADHIQIVWTVRAICAVLFFNLHKQTSLFCFSKPFQIPKNPHSFNVLVFSLQCIFISSKIVWNSKRFNFTQAQMFWSGFCVVDEIFLKNITSTSIFISNFVDSWQSGKNLLNVTVTKFWGF